MPGVLGKKIGMTSVFLPDGKNVACTVIEAGPCFVTQIKTEETDGYEAVQVGYGSKKEKNTTNALKGHFKKANVDPLRHLVEFRDFKEVYSEDLNLGDELRVESVFEEGEFVDIVGTSKGKGFQGVVKRHGFRGVGDATHGQHNRLRAPGSIGGASFPARVFKGMRMAGQTGGDRVKVLNLKIIKILPEQNLVLVGGSVPGSKNSMVILEK